MNKEQLMTKYGDEKVLCVRNKNIERNKSLNYLDIIKYYGYTDYRYNAELDFTAKQIIPYIVIVSDDKVFTTKRIQGDSRLVGNLSIGMGGHVDASDVFLTKDNLINPVSTVGNCMYRELTEETTIDTDKIKSLELRDIFIDDSNEVGKVHLCMLYVLDASGLDVDIKETNKLEGSFMTVEEIRNNYDKLESWSKITLDKLFPSVDVVSDEVTPRMSTRKKKVTTEE